MTLTNQKAMNMKNNYLIMLFQVIIVISACNSRSSSGNYKLIQKKILKTSLNLINFNVLNSDLKLNTIDSTIDLYLQDQSSGKISYFTLNKDSLHFVTEINLQSHLPHFAYFIKSIDSIFAFDNETSTLTLYDRTGSIIARHSINPNYSPLAMFPCGLIWYHNSLLLGNTSKTIGTGLTADRLHYYNEINPILKIKFNDTSLIYQPIGEFPSIYSTTGNSYYNILPSICCGNGDDLCFSFAADNNLYLYNDSSLVLKKEVESSRFIDKFNIYPDDKRFDMLFLKSYLNDEPKFEKIIYDPYMQLYYRIVKHRTKETINGKTMNTRSIIVLDKQLNVQYEVKLDRDLIPDIFIPTPHGILIGKICSNKPDSIDLAYYKLVSNEK